jgi:DNA-binding LytR/AlgR family response regulator
LKARAAPPATTVAAPPTSPVPSGEVLCLRMEDHYVRVHTLNGSRLVAGPFERVIAGMAQEGMRVHRSWWVARAAVTGVVADGRNLRLALRGGLDAPISRASVARLREAGWLAPDVAREE